MELNQSVEDITVPKLHRLVMKNTCSETFNLAVQEITSKLF